MTETLVEDTVPSTSERRAVSIRKWVTKAAGSFICAATVVIMAAVCFAMFFRITRGRYMALAMPWAEDQAIFNQGFWKLVHERTLLSTIRLDYPNILSVHFSPVIFLLAPVYALFQSPLTLFALVIAGLCGTAVVLYLTARRLTGSAICALSVALAYLLYPPLFGLATQGFRFMMLTVPLFSLALYFLVKKKLGWMLTFLLLAMLCREDAALLALGFVFLAWWNRRGWKWTWAPAVVVGVYFPLVVGVLMPWLGARDRAGGGGMEGFSYLGNSLPDIVMSVFQRYDRVLGMLGRERLLIFYKELFAPLLFLPLAGFPWLLGAITQFSIISLSELPIHSSTHYWHFAPLLPFMFVACAAGMGRIARSLQERGVPRIVSHLVMAVVLLAMAMKNGGIARLRDGWKVTIPETQLQIAELLKAVPPDASVLTQTAFTPLLSSRSVLLLPSRNTPQVDVAILNMKADTWPLTREDFGVMTSKLLQSEDYGVADRVGETFLLMRGHDRSMNAMVLKSIDASLESSPRADADPEARHTSSPFVVLVGGRNELVQNGGFETTDKGLPVGWKSRMWCAPGTTAETGVDSANVREGTTCAVIRGEAPCDARWFQSVKLRRSRVYRLSGWIKTVDVGPEGGGAYLMVEGAHIKTRPLFGTHDWEYVEAIGTLVSGRDDADVVCRLGDYGQPSRGTAYFDDLHLQGVSED